MATSVDYFNGNYIHIDNSNIPEKIADTVLYVNHAGFFTPEYCPKMKKQSEDGYLFMAVTSGKGIVKYGDELHNVSGGQCVLIDCSLPHYYMPDFEDPWGVTWINFSGFPSKMYFEMFTESKGNFFFPLNFEFFLVILKKLVENNLHKNDYTHLLNAKYITDLITSAILNNNAYDEFTNKFQHKLFSVKDYLDNNFTSQLNLDEIAEMFYISKFYLTREFKKAFGTTIIQYILHKRIEHAKELLVYTNKSIEEISEKCGFNDQSYFSRQFKKSEGMTCLTYRKKHS